MLYPRVTSYEELVSDRQMVGHREHLTQKHRIVFLQGEIGRMCISCGQGEVESGNLLLAFGSLSSAPLRLIVNSPGGDLDTTFLFYDAMRLLPAPVETLGYFCASAAALLFAAGSRRYLMPHAKVMLHQPAGQMRGFASDLDIQHKQMMMYKSKIVDILLECGVTRSAEEILRDIDRDFWLEPEEAIEYGLADEVMTKERLAEWLRPVGEAS